MKKLGQKTRVKLPADALDWSCVELQERDFLETKGQDFLNVLKENEVTEFEHCLRDSGKIG